MQDSHKLCSAWLKRCRVVKLEGAPTCTFGTPCPAPSLCLGAEHCGLVPLLLLSGNKLRVWFQPLLPGELLATENDLAQHRFLWQDTGKDILKCGCLSTLHSWEEALESPIKPA